MKSPPRHDVVMHHSWYNYQPTAANIMLLFCHVIYCKHVVLLYCYVVIKLYAYVTWIVYHVLYYCCYINTYDVIDNNNNVVVITFVYNNEMYKKSYLILIILIRIMIYNNVNNDKCFLTLITFALHTSMPAILSR